MFAGSCKAGIWSCRAPCWNPGNRWGVSERTNELEAANRELESFAYSVSHDLRAPPRAIDDFSHALEEDCADAVGDLGRDYLRRVRAAAQRMDQLIDDILQLARMTQGDMQ